MGTLAFIVGLGVIVFFVGRWEENRRAKKEEETCLVLDSDQGFFSEVKIDSKNKLLHFYSRIPDGDTTDSTYQYRFSERKLFVRVIKIAHDGLSGKYSEIVDGAVDEKEIRNHFQKAKFEVPFIERSIKEAHEEVEWKEVKSDKLVFFVASKHTEFFKAS